MHLTVPTIFTGVDKLSGIFAKMGMGSESFAKKLEIATARGERAFKKFTPTISEAGHKLFRLGEEAVSAAAIVEGIKFSGEALMEWDKALSSLRTKLSNLSDKDFTKFQNKINQVAFDTKESSIEVAAGFEKIITLNKEFAKTADELAEVSKASILLSKIQKTDVAASADGLVGIMNLYNMKAEEADKTVNVLSASQSKLASSITDTMAGLTRFAPVAKHYNISLEQATGLLDLLAEKQVKGEAAGGALEKTVIKLQAAHAGYKSGVFNLGDALEQVKERMDKFRTAKEKDNFVSGLFGKRQQATGILLLENMEKVKEYTKAVTGTTEAEKLAEISEDNMGSRLTQLKNKWVDLLTSQDKANWGLTILKKTIVFVTDHLGTIVAMGAGILAFFLAWKVVLIGMNLYLALFNKGLLGTAVAAAEASTALAAETVTVTGFGAALNGVTAEFATAEVAAGGFFAALSSFVIPAALVTLAGYSFWKQIEKGDAMLRANHSADPRTFFNPNTPQGRTSPFLEQSKEDAYQAWFVKQAKAGMNRDSLDRAHFEKLHANEFHPLIDTNKVNFLNVPVLNRPNAFDGGGTGGTKPDTRGLIEINLNDPSGAVKDITQKGGLHIPIKVTPTQGKK